jgi:hypothetical protein
MIISIKHMEIKLLLVEAFHPVIKKRRAAPSHLAILVKWAVAPFSGRKMWKS